MSLCFFIYALLKAFALFSSCPCTFPFSVDLFVISVLFRLIAFHFTCFIPIAADADAAFLRFRTRSHGTSQGRGRSPAGGERVGLDQLLVIGVDPCVDREHQLKNSNIPSIICGCQGISISAGLVHRPSTCVGAGDCK